MLYRPDLFVYLCLLPVTLLIVVPFVLGTMRNTIGVAKRMRNREDEAIELEVAPQI